MLPPKNFDTRAWVKKHLDKIELKDPKLCDYLTQVIRKLSADQVDTFAVRGIQVYRPPNPNSFSAEKIVIGEKVHLTITISVGRLTLIVDGSYIPTN